MEMGHVVSSSTMWYHEPKCALAYTFMQCVRVLPWTIVRYGMAINPAYSSYSKHLQEPLLDRANGSKNQLDR